MAESAYHMEALRRQRVIDRKKAALDKMMHGGNQDSVENVDQSNAKNTILFSGPGDYDTNRSELCRFRVNGEGFQNLYRNRDNLYPHVDKAFACIYPGKDNSDYTNDENRNNRRMNLKLDKYNIDQQVNGKFHMQVIEATPECIYNWIGTERCRRQYDHSRNGPILPSTWHNLRQELNSIGRSTPLYAGEGRPSRFDDLLAIRKVNRKK